MSSQLYVGVIGDDDRAVVTRKSTDEQLAAGLSRAYTDGRVAELAASRATKVYVDTQDAAYADADYYTSRDALNIPNSARGAANGVASLDGAGRIPAAQVPALGFGVMRGPWGITSTFGGTTGRTPLKIAEFNIGRTTWNFQPLVYLTALIEATFKARPVVEIRIGQPADTTYASQTLVGSGAGRAVFNDLQAINVLAGGAPGAMSDGVQTYYGPNFDTRLTVWAYNDLDNSGQLTVGTSAIWTAAAYIMRVAM
ncbi:hypothetical protein SEA_PHRAPPUCCINO_201 [Mycobacterium phage Phrappuccino]|uniref:Uncharacterized protein n=1 Tax=Mycobacterium phage Phrappuccino TaxID=2591223 RepID=A0A514DE41_9CAUD|nr:minor tail protein [Mycobacterium phage Phrappuccino]QDH91876.1 hypothetical protein SEA_PHRAPPUCCINO_201 [Mycobacterium phage Phrappuccino]QIQ63342.1 hypothetical protein SEA_SETTECANDELA_226 [Mycobacterium phage Settecandela]